MSSFLTCSRSALPFRLLALSSASILPDSYPLLPLPAPARTIRTTATALLAARGGSSHAMLKREFSCLISPLIANHHRLQRIQRDSVVIGLLIGKGVKPRLLLAWVLICRGNSVCLASRRAVWRNWIEVKEPVEQDQRARMIKCRGWRVKQT